MSWTTRSKIARYGSALVAFGMAVLARLVLERLLGIPYPMISFFLAVIYAAWYCGLGPSILVIVLSALAAPLFLSSPARILDVGSDALSRLLMFLTGALAVALMGGSLCAAREQAEKSARAAAAERRRLEQEVVERRRVEKALRGSEERFRVFAEAMPQIAWISRASGALEYINGNWFTYTGMTREQTFSPHGGLSAIHPDDRAAVLEAEARSLASGDPFEAEYRLCGRDGVYRWFLGRSVVVDEGAGPSRRFGTATDIDDRKRTEQAAQFLAAAGGALAALEDEATALGRVAALAVPQFADWCAIDVMNDQGGLQRTTLVHADPAKTAVALEFYRRCPPTSKTSFGVHKVVQTSRSRLMPEITDADLKAKGLTDDFLEVLQLLGLKSYLCVPMIGRAGIFGAISFVLGDSGRRYGPSELLLAEDLASRAAVAVENARLYAALTETDRRKSEFLAMLAHELRNPLAPLQHTARLLATAPETPAELGEEVAMIERQVVHLARLVDDLLDVSRISQGKIGLKREHVDLNRIVQHAVATVSTAASERHHELSVTYAAGPVPLLADPTRMEQVVANLLNNAVKYTEPGGHIGVIVEADAAAGAATFRVRDDGIGIAPGMLARVFELFVQGEPGAARSQGGLGVGLSLVRSLVELHGGTISAVSEGLGRGSEFVVQLPLAVTSRPPTEHPRVPARSNGAAGTPTRARGG